MRALLLGTGGLLCALAVIPILFVGEAAYLVYLMDAPRPSTDPYIRPYVAHFYFQFGDHQIDGYWATGGAALIAFTLIAAGIWLLKAGLRMQHDGHV